MRPARPRPFPRRYPARRRGIILFVVTVIIAALTLGGMSLLALMRVELEATRQRLTDLELANAARSGAALTLKLSGLTADERARFGGVYDNPALFCNRIILPPEQGGEGTAFTILSPRLEAERGGVRYGLVNESARLNLAALLDWDRESPGTAKSVLMKLPGMTSIMADSLLDWIDPDESVRPDGAEAGFRIEMDDFGSGYSSLNMLSRMPIDVLKLDMYFIRNIFKNEKNMHILKLMMDIKNFLSVPVVAEGVETREQMDVLKDMGCGVIQGYYFSPPVPPEKFEAFIKERTAK